MGMGGGGPRRMGVFATPARGTSYVVRDSGQLFVTRNIFLMVNYCFFFTAAH